jgi:hypothetical protein
MLAPRYWDTEQRPPLPLVRHRSRVQPWKIIASMCIQSMRPVLREHAVEIIEQVTMYLGTLFNSTLSKRPM